MQVTVTILVENTTPVPELIGEYGFSCLISIDGREILFDTGSSGALFANSKALGVNLVEVKDIFISHGHYDHTGALLPLLQGYGPKRIFTHPQMLLPKLFPLKNGRIKKIGSPAVESQLLAAGAELIKVDSLTPIWPGVYISGEIPRTNDFEDVGGNFKVEMEGQVIDDHLVDDMALIIDHPQGLIVISGCGHAGLVNILEHAQHLTGKKQVLAYIGGTHLMTASVQRLDRTIEVLKHFELEKLIIAHCTGFYAGARLFCELGEKVIKAEAGMKFNF